MKGVVHCISLVLCMYQINAHHDVYSGQIQRQSYGHRPALPPGYAYVEMPSTNYAGSGRRYGSRPQASHIYNHGSSYYEDYQPSTAKSLYQSQSPYFNNYYDSYQQDPYQSQSSYSSNGHYDYNQYQQQAAPDYHYDSHQDMGNYERSYGHQPSYHRPHKTFVPVIIKKKTQKKKKIISVQHGFYITGGTQMFGKFKDLYSCQKACAITATCFAGDYDPWLGKCFMHGNNTACQSMSSHPAIIHFKKVPCALVETPRGLITLGTQAFKGLEQKGVKDLKSCIKKCATAGGGIAPTPETVSTTPQICFGIDYDFATHRCYIHTDSTLCSDPTILTPQQLVARASSVNILLCPRTTK